VGLLQPIDRYVSAVDPMCPRRRQKSDDVGHLLCGPQTAHWKAVADIVIKIFLVGGSDPSYCPRRELSQATPCSPGCGAAQIPVPNARYRNQRCLCRAVPPRHCKLRRPAGNRCHIYDCSTGAALHMRERQPHHPHGLDQVPFDSAAPIVIRAIGDARSSAATTDVVDQDINPAKGRDRGLDQPAASSGLLTSAA
jgi:hypothetical protein